MKTITFIIAILITNFAFAQDAWQRMNPSPQENSIKEIIKIPGTDKIMAICKNSTLMTSEDEGETWDVQINPCGMPNPIDLYDITFLDENNGYIATKYGRILKTTDGGINWDSLYVNTKILTHIHVFSQNKIIVSAKEEYIYLTEDGGNNWQEISTGFPTEIVSMEFTNENTGYLLTFDGNLLQSNDGGISWELLMHLDMYMDDMLFVDEDEGYMVGQNVLTYCLRTMDGGNGWDTVWFKPGFQPVSIEKAENEIMIAGFRDWYMGWIYNSTDQGENWTQNVLPLDRSMNINILGLSADKFLATGEFGQIIKTEDHFANWEDLQQTNSIGNVNDLQFINQTAYAATTDFKLGTGGVGGKLFKSTDNGNTWNPIAGNLPVRALHFTDENTGYYITRNSIEKSIDGFESQFTFMDFDNSQDQEPTGIFFFDDSTGFIAIDNNGTGIIRKTTDGGDTWNEVFSEQERIPGKFLFLNETTGFAVGRPEMDSPTLLRTTDAGETWTSWEVDLGSTTDIFFTNDQKGFVTLHSNAYYLTIDGGENWELVVVPSNFVLNTVFFSNDSVGYLAGGSIFQNILKTTNGGDNWFPIEQASTGPIYRMHFFDEDNGMVFGRYGLISKTESGGITGIEDQHASGYNLACKTYPNPFDDQLTIEFTNPPGEDLTIHIYNVQGKLIRSEKPGNIRSFTWNGTDQNGRKLNNGLYLCRIRSGSAVATEVVVLINKK